MGKRWVIAEAVRGGDSAGHLCNLVVGAGATAKLFGVQRHHGRDFLDGGDVLEVEGVE